MSLQTRGIRGATTATANTKKAILEATTELLEQLIEANEIKKESIAAALFSTTKDLNAEFPAVAARVGMGWTEVAMMCSHEADVPDALSKCIRVLLLVNTERQADGVVNVYLREAVNLRARGTENG